MIRSLILLLFLFAFSCLALEAQEKVSNEGHSVFTTNGQPAKHGDFVAKKLSVKCGTLDFELSIVQKSDSRSLEVIHDNTVLKTMSFPIPSANGPLISDVELSKGGFKLSVEYGSRIYYQRNFDFTCRGGGFFLTRMDYESYDKFDPEHYYRKGAMPFRPGILLEKVSLEDYMFYDHEEIKPD